MYYCAYLLAEWVDSGSGKLAREGQVSAYLARERSLSVYLFRPHLSPHTLYDPSKDMAASQSVTANLTENHLLRPNELMYKRAAKFAFISLIFPPGKLGKCY